jgi:hypothetical protein
MAGAVLHGTAAAQDSTKIIVPAAQRADSVLRDSLAKIAARERARDSARKADSIKAPIVHAERPLDLGIARRFYWNRDSLFATGAITLADLLERVPGITTFHAGWIASPAVGAYLGDVRRVRVFFDGFEYLPLDPRGHGALDMTHVNLWAAEDVTIEQAAEEVRVYIRSWRVRSTTPETRTDISTGDQQTNMYRGFFGKRFDNATLLQFGAQQYGTTPSPALGTSSDQTGIIGRAGWAGRGISIDGFLTRINRHRGVIRRDLSSPGDSIRDLASNRNDAYLRVGSGDADVSPFWWQALAVTSKYDYNGVRTDTLIKPPKTPEDTAFNNQPLDTSVTRSQYTFTAGAVRGPFRLSGGARIIAGGGKSFVSPTARASFWSPMLAASAFLDGKNADSVSRMDVTAQIAPLSFVSVFASAGRTTDARVKDSSYSATYVRGEAGFRVKNLWLLGGVIRRDSATLPAPAVFDTLYARHGEGAATGVTAGIRGQVWKIINADVSAIRWNDSTGFYRPRYQTRSELYLRTDMRKYVPNGNLGIMASLVHEYRSGVNFPVVGNSVANVPGYRTISSLLEIRILRATISWQFRNFLGERYSQVPGFIAPRQTNFYGVRWTFFD